MKQLLIVAHGSRRSASNDEIRILAGKISEYLELPAQRVQVAFLELALPSIATALNACFENGVDEVCVLPYFLASGSHVVTDVPREIAAVQSKWPNKIIKVLPHIGAAEGMVKLIANTY